MSARSRQHPDRDAQFQHINPAIERFRRDGQPAISVDTKKKELVGDFKSTAPVEAAESTVDGVSGI